MFTSAEREECTERLTAFETAMLPSVERLFRIACWTSGDRDMAETLVEETFAQAFDTFDEFESGANCCVWLAKIMHRVGKTRRHYLWGERKNLRLVGSGNDDDEPVFAGAVQFEPRTPQDATGAELLRAFGSLTRKGQEVIMLSDIEDIKYKEIADILNLSLAIVMSRLSRARKLMRTELAGLVNRRMEADVLECV